MQHLGMVPTGTRTDRHAHFQAHPCLLNVHSRPGAAGRECSTLHLATFYRPLGSQGQTDSIMYSLKFFALGKIRKCTLSYFGFSGHRSAVEIRKGWWWALHVVAQDSQGYEGNWWWGYLCGAPLNYYACCLHLSFHPSSSL